MKTTDRGEYVLAFSDGRSVLGLVGGKGASLSRLAAEGYPVPPGFHVSTAAYRDFAAANGLEKRIEEELAGLDPDRPDEIERASSKVREAFLAAPVPAAIEAALREAYDGLRGEAPPFEGAASGPGREPAWPAVAVRSSATAEDLPGLSFAGQQETFLDVRGPQALVEAVRRCWASLWNGRAVAYRLTKGYGEEGIALAVVVQLLVDADAAGILFTADPVSGRRGVSVIDAAFGLGESVVGGRVSPDILVVEKLSGRVLERQTADKELRTVRLPGGGTDEAPCPEELRRAPVLSDTEAAALASLGSRVEASYGTPVDIEWARSGGRFWLLQARPITALPDEEPEPPTEWLPPAPKAVVARGSIVDFAPEPLAPLFASLGIRIYEAAFKETVDELTGKSGVLEGVDYCAIVNGYLYVHMRFPFRYFVAVVGVLGKVFRRLKDTRPIIEAARARYEKAVSAWEGRDLAAPGSGELLDAAEGLWGEACRFVQCFQTGAAGAGTFEFFLGRLWEKGLRRPGEPPASAFVLGFENEATRADESLWDLTRLAAADEALSYWLRTAPVDGVVSALCDTKQAGAPAAASWGEFRVAFRIHLDRHCRAIFDLDFSKPLQSEDPVPVVLAMRNWLEGRGMDPRDRREAAARRREELTAAALERARGLKGWLFRKVLGWAQNSSPLREDAIAGFGIGYPSMRRIFRELGGRLAARGAIERADDLYWLEEGELIAAVRALDSGGAPADLRSAVRARRALWRSRKRVRPPSTVPKTERIMGIKTAAFLPPEESEGSGKLRGVGASGGRVRATARVLRDFADFGSMKSGEVLVAQITTPAWTPLFALASAVVTDIGGPLSHGSIVAREYGIPAVLGTGAATRRIRSGDLVLVDGDAGTVTWDEAAS